MFVGSSLDSIGFIQDVDDLPPLTWLVIIIKFKKIDNLKNKILSCLPISTKFNVFSQIPHYLRWFI